MNTLKHLSRASSACNVIRKNLPDIICYFFSLRTEQAEYILMKSPTLPPIKGNRDADLQQGDRPLKTPLGSVCLLINIWSAEQTGPDAYWSPLLPHGYNIDQRLQATADTFSILEVTVSQKSHPSSIRSDITLHYRKITTLRSKVPSHSLFIW